MAVTILQCGRHNSPCFCMVMIFMVISMGLLLPHLTLSQLAQPLLQILRILCFRQDQLIQNTLMHLFIQQLLQRLPMLTQLRQSGMPCTPLMQISLPNKNFQSAWSTYASEQRLVTSHRVFARCSLYCWWTLYCWWPIHQLLTYSKDS